MGDRGQVKVGEIYLYTHWGAYKLIDDVYSALKKHWRWNDPCYLARIIFDEMTLGMHDEETGFGICGNQHGDIWRLIEISGGNVAIRKRKWNEDDLYWITEYSDTFKNFLKAYEKGEFK